MDSVASGLSFDLQLSAIHHIERRQLLLALLKGVATDETPLDVTQLPPRTDEQQLRMHHVHLPKLRQMGIIESSGEQSHVSRGPHFDDIVPLLRIIDTYRDELPTDVL